jgi:formamidopyrimidine-DNA glycosylase
MPELPDITLYCEALEQRILGRRLERARLNSPFLLRSVEPRLDAVVGASVAVIKRIGKRIAIGFDNDHWLVFHLMIAGRLHWRDTSPKALPKQTAIALDFANGALTLTEAGTKKRASLNVVRGHLDLAQHDPGGLEIDAATVATFQAALQRRNHTLKRALTDPRLLSGIGNAYSASSSAVAGGVDEQVVDGRLRAVAVGDARGARGMVTTVARAGRRRISGARDRVSRRDGRARALRQTVPGVRNEGAAHPLRKQRDELLPAVPDRRAIVGRSLAVAPLEERLAEVDR